MQIPLKPLDNCLHCRIGSLETDEVNKFKVMMASLPNRQLRNVPEPLLVPFEPSLPNRQLRNENVAYLLKMFPSLPNRQLRKFA